jgi:N-acetylglucosaminyldiphosphoundecaprenol N-acetyl-beta-D-mannosaminyltransferase
VASPDLPSVRLFRLSVANAAMGPALDWLCARLDQGEPTRVAFLNAHCANLASVRPSYRRALEEADAVLPDGSGVALAALLRGTPLAANLNGTDLIPALCERLAVEGRSVFLLGGEPGVAACAAAVLAKAYPGLRIAGTQHGFFAAEEEDQMVAAINAVRADVLLVALGAPAQDIWLQRVAPRLDAALRFGVGGLFDFLSGRVPRAPLALRRLGLEWTYRLYREPVRLWRRYVVGNPAFVLRAVADAAPYWAGKIELLLKRINIM